MQPKVIDTMPDIKTQISRHIHDALGVAVTVTAWKNGGRVLPFLQDRYRFFVGQLLGERCLFMADKEEEEQTPAAIGKHLDQVRGKWNDPVVYVRERITAYNRKRLIEHKVPFIVPGNQMYLPMLGIDLREHFRKPRLEKNGLGPAAQAVLIHSLLRNAENLSPTALAEKLGYSVMTMSRTLDELEATGLGQSTSIGRERRLRLVATRREIWEKAQPVLRNPVKARHVIHRMPGGNSPGPQAGLSALAHYTMLAEPANASFAVGREDWAAFQRKDASRQAMPDEPDAITVEVWHYAPTLFAVEGCVDRLSLYLSLRDTHDERVQAALEQMVKEVPW